VISRAALALKPHDGALLAVHDAGSQIAAATVVEVKRVEVAE